MADASDDDEQELDEHTLARDFCMARLAAARTHVVAAGDAIDAALMAFVDPEAAEDEEGKDRAEFLETIDESLGAAALAVQAAQGAWPDVDPAEGEPEPDEE